MKLANRIIAGRIQNLEGLDPPARRRAQAASGLTELLSENAALATLTAQFPPAPPWENLRDPVITLANNPEVRTMTEKMSKLRHSRAARLAFGAVVVLAVAAALLLTPLSGLLGTSDKAWAVSDGYVLKYNVPASAWADGSDCRHEDMYQCDCAYLGNIWRAAMAWGQENGIQLEPPSGGRRVESLPAVIPLRSKLTLDSGERQATVEVLAIGLTAQQVEQLRQRIEQASGLGGAAVEEASWYYIQSVAYDGYCFDIAGHQFGFPENATAEQMEQLIGQWLRDNHGSLPPEAAGVSGVDIELSKGLSGRNLNIKLLHETPAGGQQ